MFLKLIVLITIFFTGYGYELKQVVVLSRHHIRTPFRYNIDTELLTPKQLPTWNIDYGYLTPKGYLLERYMGKYFTDWMIEKKLLENNCPKDEVYVYANSLHRTKETAKAFTEGGFGDCVRVHYKNITGHDPIFKFNVKNSSAEFKQAVLDDMRNKLNHTNLRDAYMELNRIVDFGNSSYCKTHKICDLSVAETDIVFESNIPDVTGGLDIGRSLVDSFLMAYYDGMPTEKVAWGQIQTEQQWKSLIAILEAYLQVLFENQILSRDIASPTIEYLTDIFQNGTKKFYLIVAQDANIRVLTTYLDFKPYVLPGQLERTPIGGKLVFEKWHDKEHDKDFLRVNYVYQSSEQLRNGVEVNLQNPPLWQILEMKNCTVDENGFCPWNDFISILNSV